MPTRESFFSLTLPLIENMLNADSGVSPFSMHPVLFIVGPEANEIEKWAPRLLEFPYEEQVKKFQRIIPVYDGMSMESLLRADSEWRNHEGVGSCLRIFAIPPDCKLDLQDLSPDRQMSDHDLEGLDPSLCFGLLSHDCFYPHSGLYAIPRSALADDVNLIARREMLLRTHPHRFHDSIFTDRGANRPVFIWEVEAESEANVSDDGDHVTLTLFSSWGNCLGKYIKEDWPPRVTHFRRLNEHDTHRLATCSEFAEQLLRIASGQSERSDDDRFVTSQDLLKLGSWTVPDDQVTIDGLSSGIEATGYPIKRVREVCHLIERRDAGQARHPERLYARCQVSENELIVAESESGDKLDENCIEIDADDLRYLELTFHDPAILDQIRCKSFSPINKPIINETILGDLSIPWPNAETRRNLLERHDQLVKFANDLGDDIERANAYIGYISDLVTKTPPWYEDVLFRELEDIVREIAAGSFRAFQLGRQRIKLDGIYCGRHLPIPLIKSLERLKKTSSSTDAFDILRSAEEFMLLHETSILAAALRVIDPNNLREIVLGLNRDQDGNINFTPSTVVYVNQRLRASLCKNWTGHSRKIPSSLRPLIASISNLPKGELTVLREALKDRRNNWAHSYQGTDEENIRNTKLIIEQLSTTIELTKGLYESDLFHLRNMETVEDLVLVTKQPLTGPSSDYCIQEIEKPAESPYGSTPEGQCYFNLQVQGKFISLAPWILFEKNAYWHVHRIGEDGITYRSPDLPGERMPKKWMIDSMWQT
ncbi:MAG: hypothetical protein O7G85_14430 [Planctomycetota bacterium]|nr:hypothetical protein [Planctomycetota bacterium]